MIYSGMIAKVVPPQQMVLWILRLGGGPVRPGMEVSVEADGQPGCRLAKRTAADDPEPRRQAIRPGREALPRFAARFRFSVHDLHAPHNAPLDIIIVLHSPFCPRSEKKIVYICHFQVLKFKLISTH